MLHMRSAHALAAQLGLFEADPVELVRSRAAAVAPRIPPNVRLGASSWTFPGWGGIVYAGRPSEAELRRRGLAEYAQFPLFRTVGVDRAFYDALRPTDLVAYARDLAAAPGFSAVVKTTSKVATHDHAGVPAPHFLDGDVMLREVVEPLLRYFAPHLGVILLELSPQSPTCRMEPSRFVDRLGAFLARMPRAARFAVELRNREFLNDEYAAVLREHGVAHCFNGWRDMPGIYEQARMAPVFGVAPFRVCRVMLPPGRTYEEQMMELAPFREIRRRDERMRREVSRLIERAREDGAETWVVVSNKVEGCGPMTVVEIAEGLEG